MQPVRFRPLRLLLSGALLCLLVGGCKVTSEDIEYWKGTVKGPGKIVAVIVTDKYPMELRTQSALALVEMERQDVNGVAELQRALLRLPDDTRRNIIDLMVPGLQALMRGDGTAQVADDPLTGPPAEQVRAKDAAYLLISHASPQARQQLTDAIMGWYEVDFNGRSLAGDYSAEQIIRSLGTPAAAKLVDALNARLPQQALIKIAELIGQLGDTDTKTRGAQRLVEIEQEMETQEYVDWLKNKIRESLAEQQRQVDESRINAVAELNRNNFINEGALPAMKNLASEPSIAERLLVIAENRENNEERRKRALQALEGNAAEAQLRRYLALALDDQAPIGVRDYAFDRIGDIRSRDAIPPLWPLVESAENDRLKKRLRWRAAEMILHIGGAQIVNQVFSKLPTGDDVEYEPEELEGYATRLGRITPPPTQLMSSYLRSSQWWQRVVALRFFERKGTEADIARLQPLTRDTAVCKGEAWEEGFTVGKVAEAAIAALRERLAQPEAQQPAGGGQEQQ